MSQLFISCGKSYGNYSYKKDIIMEMMIQGEISSYSNLKYLQFENIFNLTLKVFSNLIVSIFKLRHDFLYSHFPSIVMSALSTTIIDIYKC